MKQDLLLVFFSLNNYVFPPPTHPIANKFTLTVPNLQEEK